MWISSLALLMRVERGDYTTQVYTTNLLSETSDDDVRIVVVFAAEVLVKERDSVNQKMSNLFTTANIERRSF